MRIGSKRRWITFSPATPFQPGAAGLTDRLASGLHDLGARCHFGREIKLVRRTTELTPRG
jgi:hypothetical protein